MTATTTDRPARADPSAGLGRSSHAYADRTFRYLTLAAGLLVLVILGLIAYSMTKQGLPAFRDYGLRFLTKDDWIPESNHFGALAFIYGTVVVSLIAVLFAVPVSVGIALFLTDVAPKWLRKPVTFVVDLLAAIPSVVFGLWAVNSLAQPLSHVFGHVASALHGVPVLGALFSDSQGGGGNGRAFMTAGFILALMITPIITAITREVFDTTPKGQKEAALALGATRWEVIKATVFPHSKAGFTGAVLLGLGRALGETIAVALIIGSSAKITSHLFSSGDAMPSVIANQFGQASGDWRAALIAMGVVLFVMTIVVNLVARWIVGDRSGAGQGVGV